MNMPNIAADLDMAEQESLRQMDTLLRPFTDPDRTREGQRRAQVALRGLETLWFNTGTLCNLSCANCYIESSPRNDRLVYLDTSDVRPFLDEISVLDYATREIGFTGGEPFMNPDMAAMAGLCLDRGFDVLILTNAMQPMQRPRVKQDLVKLKEAHGSRLKLRISIDHFTAKVHDDERGAGSFARTIEGLAWLVDNGFVVSVAGRILHDENERDLRAGYARLFLDRRVHLDADNARDLVLFPEMDATAPAPEITTDCWGILGVSPDAIMCATSRMVVRRKGSARAVVMPCTLLPYDPAFEMGPSLSGAARADGGNFDDGAVKLNHPHCARFCVLGGGSCAQ